MFYVTKLSKATLSKSCLPLELLPTIFHIYINLSILTSAILKIVWLIIKRIENSYKLPPFFINATIFIITKNASLKFTKNAFKDTI